jgi:3-oxoadipate CoA-transferase alpha subunit
MIEKQVPSLAEAISEIHSGATVLVGGFGDAGSPVELLEALLETDVRELTIVANNAGSGNRGLASLLREGRVRKVICSYPRSKGSVWFERRFLANEVELEVVPQGTLTERIRAAGAGIGGFFTTTGVGSELAAGKETRVIDGREYLFEMPLFGDVALIKAQRADRWGNLVYHASGRNYGPTMAAAAQLTIAQVDEIVPLGSIDPETVVTPGVLVDRVVKVVAGKA